MDHNIPANDKYEYRWERIFLWGFTLFCLLLGIIGDINCTALHPCAVWAQMMSNFGYNFAASSFQLLLVFNVLRSIGILGKKVETKTYDN